MNTKEREQLKMFKLIEENVISQVEAAARLRCSARWVRKKFKRFLQGGDASVIHQGRGRSSPKRWSQAEEGLLIKLLQAEWRDFGPTFSAEKLESLHGIKVSREVVRRAMIRAGLWIPKKKRSVHRKRRERRPMLGMMVQLDGSPHDWFEGRAGKCTLLVFIDDATSQILWLEFAKSESTEALMRATKNYISKYGRPGSFYTDHGSVFHVNLNNQESDKKTQWERACDELKIEVIHANSPQAKGRVERCNQTMQDRLVKEMRLANISSIAAANDYLRQSGFIQSHNQRHAVATIQQGDAHASLDCYDLNRIFTIKETRNLNNDYTIVYQKRIFQLFDCQKTTIHPGDDIIVKTHLDSTITLWIRKIKLNYHMIKTRPSIKPQENKITQPKPCKPSPNSRRWVSGFYPILESRVKPAQPAVEANLNSTE